MNYIEFPIKELFWDPKKKWLLNNLLQNNSYPLFCDVFKDKKNKQECS